MTKPNDTDNDIAVTSRRLFLRNGSSLGGAAIAEGPFGCADAFHFQMPRANCVRLFLFQFRDRFTLLVSLLTVLRAAK